MVLGGCSQIELDQTNKIDEGEVLEIKDQELSFSIFQIVSIDLGKTTFSDGQILGTTLEGEKIDLIIEDNILTFMVPKLNQGSYKLVFKENNTPFNILFEVKPHTLSGAPSGFVESLVTQSQERIQDLERTKDLLVGEKKVLLESDISILKKQNEDLIAKMALLKESELADMAYFLEANREWMDEVVAALAEFNSALPNGRILNDHRINIEERSSLLMQKFTKAVIAVVKHIPKIVTAASLGFAGGSVIPIVGSFAGAVLGAGWAVGNLMLDIKELFAQIDANAEFVQQVADDAMESRYRLMNYVFENGKDYELFVSRNYRTLYKGDESSTNPEVKNYLSSFSQLLTDWVKVELKLSLGLGYQPTNPATLPTFTSKSSLVHSDHLSIAGITNSKVTGSAKKENGSLFLTFKTDEKETQEFEFKLVYQNQDFGRLEKSLSAEVKIQGPEYGTYTDPRDGNVYKTVKIGTQTWFAENLRYAGNIPQVASKEEWLKIYYNKTSQPAWVYYNNDPNYNSVYGKLYNWYAVNTGSLCPQGWHIPTFEEWKYLRDFLGGYLVGGGKMKSQTGWNAPNQGATNESGFSGLPGGERYFNSNAAFYGLGKYGFWWSSSTRDDRDAYSFSLYYTDSNPYLVYYEKVRAQSCRCIKD